jgi:cytochrome d ubiquinol oxidase subunit I
MKMAAAEAIYNTKSGASFSILTIGDLKGNPVFQIRIPHLLSMIADLSWNGQVRGVDQIQAAETAKHGTASYVPVLWITYWSFRLMVGAAVLLLLLTLWGLVLARRKNLATSRWFVRVALAAIVLPFLANTTGWIFTEAGRQPWLVYGLMRTVKGASATTMADVTTTLVGFVGLYALLGAVDAVLMFRAARQDLPEADSTGTPAVSDLVY